MNKISRSLLAGALLVGGLVVGGGANVAQAACADDEVTFSGTVSNGASNATVHLSVGDPGSDSGWTDFDLATVDWENLFTFAASQGMLTEEEATSFTSLMDAQTFTDTTVSGAYEICVASDAIDLIGNLMMMMSEGDGDGGDGGQGGGTPPTAADHLGALVGEGPSFGYQIIAIPSLGSWTPGETAPSLGATASEIKASDDCTSSCSFTTFAMEAPTIWGQDTTGEATDVYLLEYGSRGGSALADIPTVIGGGISKFAAAFEFSAYNTYSVVGGTFSSNSFARVIETGPSDDGSISLGYVENGNLTGEILDSNGDSLSSDTQVNLSALNIGSSTGVQTATTATTADLWSNGGSEFFANIRDGETYKITADVSGFPSADCYVTNTDGELAIPSEPASSDCAVAESDHLGIWELTITLGEASAAFVVKNGVGEAVGDIQVMIGERQYDWFYDDNYSAGSDGVVGWSPELPGWHRIALSPPVEVEATEYLFTDYYVEVAIAEDGTVSITDTCEQWDYSVSSTEGLVCTGTDLARNADDRFEFIMDDIDLTDPSQIQVNVTNNGAAVERSRVRVEQNNAQGWFQYVFETETNSLGQVAFTLPVGKYKLTASPSWDDDTGMAAVNTTLCITDEGATDCFGGSLDNDIEMALASPNVTGTVYIEEDGEVADYVWGSVEMFNPVWNNWMYVANLNTNGEGTYRVSLDPAERPYKLNVEPPWGTTGIVKAKTYVMVEEDGVCEVADENETSCDGVYDTQIDIVYPPPNFSGTVTAGGVGTWAYIQAEVWNGNMWQWASIWVQTNMRGEFATNLEANPVGDDAGTFYKVTANPQDWNSGYSRRETIVEMRDVDEDGSLDWCETEANAYGMPVACDADDFNDSGDEIEIALRGANFVGEVTNALEEDHPVPYSYVEVVRPSDSGWQTWVASSQTNALGRFSANIELTTSEWTKIEVRANPPWGVSGLVKVVRSYWVGDEDGDGTASDICTVNPIDADVSCEEADGDLVSADTPEEFSLGGGNLNGTITDPTTGLGAANIQVQIEKVIESDWNGDGTVDSTWYQWMGLWAQSSASGVYTAQVTDPGPTWGDTVEGTFRVTARPWGRTDVAEKSVVFCLEGEVVDEGCDGLAEVGVDEDVDITLAEPNIQGVVTTSSGVPVGNAWLALEQRFEYDWSGDGLADWEWWSFTGRGANTNSDGEFSMFVDVTADPVDYRVSVNPPWNWSGDPLVRFNSVQFTFESGATEAMDFTDGADGALEFPSPKLMLTVVDQDGDVVPQAWVQVEELVEYDWDDNDVVDWSWWQWRDSYGGTNFEGEVALDPALLDLATSVLTKWRVVVNPPWNSSGTDLPRFETLVSDIVDTDADPASITGELVFPAANFTGTVYSVGDETPDDPTDDAAMPWSWISIESFEMNDAGTPVDPSDDFMWNFQWVAGGNTNNEGEFSLRVSDGDGEEDTYLVRFHSNGWGSSSPPIEALVTFDGEDVLTSWVYRIAPDDEQCDGSDCTVDMYFDHVPPNVTLTITEGDEPITEGKVWVKFIDENGSETVMTGRADEDGVDVLGLLTASGTYTIRVTFKDASNDITCRELGSVSVDISPEGGFSTNIDLITSGSACV